MDKQPRQRQLEGFEYTTPESVLAYFRRNRIDLGPEFVEVYSSFSDDEKTVANLHEKFRNLTDQDSLGPLGEALIFACVERGALGSGITARGASLYDDYTKRADVIIEGASRQMRDPIISSIDVTVSQQVSSVKNKSSFEAGGAETFVSEFEKKVKVVKSSIEYIAKYPREEAVHLYAWIQSGGLSEPKTNENRKFFEDAEKIMLLKYYTNPKNSDEPNKPHCVLAGPKIVLSIDPLFVNRAFSGGQQEKAISDVKILIQAEVPLAVAAFGRYLDNLAISLTKNGQPPNLFFDMIRSSCKSWELTFSTEINQMRIQRAVKSCLSDPDLRKQLAYYQGTLTELFNLK